MTYEAYLEKMRAIGRNRKEQQALLDEAAEDPDVSARAFMSLLYESEQYVRRGVTL